MWKPSAASQPCPTKPVPSALRELGHLARDPAPPPCTELSQQSLAHGGCKILTKDKRPRSESQTQHTVMWGYQDTAMSRPLTTAGHEPPSFCPPTRPAPDRLTSSLLHQLPPQPAKWTEVPTTLPLLKALPQRLAAANWWVCDICQGIYVLFSRSGRCAELSVTRPSALLSLKTEE